MAHVDTPTRTEHVAKRRRISGKVNGNTPRNMRERIYTQRERAIEEDGSEDQSRKKILRTCQSVACKCHTDIYFRIEQTLQ